MTLNINPNTPITGVVTTKPVTDEVLFQEYYRCSIELTEKKSFQRVIMPMVVGSTPFNPDDSVGFEKVVAVHMTESMYDDLVHRTAEMIREDNQRRKNPVVMDLWSKYKMMLGLMK
jgi:hypothetical protein